MKLSIKAGEARVGMRWLDKAYRCSLITSVRPSQIEGTVEIVCKGTKAGVGEGVRVPAIDIHFANESEIISVEINNEK